MKRLLNVLALGMVMVLLGATQGETQTAFPFFDNAEDEGVSASYWTPDADTWGVKATAAYSGNQAWSIKQEESVWQYLTLSGTIDLTSAENPYVSFWLRTLDGRADYSVHVSSDGGANWEGLASDSYTNTSGEWVRKQWSLDSYRNPDALIRIGTYRRDTGVTVQIDDILIDDAPVPHTVRLLEPTNNGFRVVWDESTSDDFQQYTIYIDTRSDFGSSEGVSGRQEKRTLVITDKATTEMTLTDLAFANMRYYARIYETDTQGLQNQGSEVVDSQTSFQVTPEVAPFLQDFEGSFQWAADLPWLVTEETGDEEGHSATHAWEDSPISTGQANYPRAADRRLVAQIDFSGVARPVLRFKHRYIFEEENDRGWVQYSLNNINWTTIAGFSGSDGVWRTEEFDLGVLSRQPRAYLLFQTVSNSSSERDGWYIDDVEVFDNAKTLTFPFFDDVEDTEQTRQNWTLGQWDVQTTLAQSGDQVLASKQKTTHWTYLTLSGTIDLTSAGNPTLSFWLRTLDGRADYSVQVSSDGGANWEGLASDGYTNTSGEWVRKQQPLDSYRNPDVLIRIGTYRRDASVTVQIDDISIDFPPTILGDVSGDNDVNALDASLVLRYVVGLIPLGPNGMEAADVSGNGSISPLDATYILQYVAQLITVWPAETEPGKLIASSGILEWAEALVGRESGQVILPLVLDDPRNVTSVQFTGRIDPALVSVEGVTSRLPDDWQIAYHVEDGELRLAMAGATPVEAGELARLQLRLLQPEARPTVRGTAIVNENPSTELAGIALGVLPASSSLGQNYPNPFNPATHIQYHLAAPADVQLSIFNLVGQKIRTLSSGPQPAGTHVLRWDGRDDAGRQMESGVYLYRLEADGLIQTRKMVLVQ
jgi:hypothetical protein